MPYSDYINGLIKSQYTFSSGSEILKTTAISTISSSTQVTISATTLINTAVLIINPSTFTSIQFPSIENIIAALIARSYTVTNGIIIDIILVNLTDHRIAILTNNLLDPVGLGATTIEVNHVHSYKIISDIVGGATTFRIYLISGGNDGGGSVLPIITTTLNKTAIGVDALKFSTGQNNKNTAIGFSALFDDFTVSNDNTAIGHLALQTLSTSCINNTAVGLGTEVIGGDNNTVLGYIASASTRSDCVVLGEGAIANGDDQFVIGSTLVNAGTVGATGALTINHNWLVRIKGQNYKIPLNLLPT